MMTGLGTRLVIEMKGPDFGWHTISYLPDDNLDTINKKLQWFQNEEIKNKYGEEYRIVRETREILTPNMT